MNKELKKKAKNDFEKRLQPNEQFCAWKDYGECGESLYKTSYKTCDN